VKILVTGATGFIGKRLVQLLVNKGYQVRALVHNKSLPENIRDLDGVEEFKGDITDPSSLENIEEGIDAVCHLAALLGGAPVDEQYYADLNITGTNFLLNIFKDRNIEKFIYCSTTGVMGLTGERCCDESEPFKPSNLYEETKVEAEKLVRNAMLKNKINGVVLRPGLVYGPGDMHHLGLFKAIKSGAYFLINGGGSYLDPVYVDDVVGAFLEVLKDPSVKNQVLNIAGQKPVKVKEFSKIIAKKLGRIGFFISLPKSFAMFLAACMIFICKIFNIDSVLTKSRVNFLSESRTCSISKAKLLFDYSPISLDEGIEKTVLWYRNHGYL